MAAGGGGGGGGGGAGAWARWPGRGVRADWAARAPEYAGDWGPLRRGGAARVAAASAYIFCASAIPALAFGEQFNHETKGALGIVETLAATGLAGVLQAAVGGQPLLIVGVAEPIVIVYAFMYKFTERAGLPFLPWAACACCWASGFLLVLCIANACDLIRHFTRFSGELFGMLIAVLFMQQAFLGSINEFKEAYGAGVAISEAWQLFGGVFSLVLCLTFVFACMLLSGARHWRFLFGWTRSFLADYAAPFCLLVFTGVSFAVQGGGVPSSIPRRINVPNFLESSWLESGYLTAARLGEIPPGSAAAAAVPGLIIAVLFYFDHSVSSQLAQTRDLGVVKPSAFHWDLLWISLVTLLFGLVGLPPVNGVLPQAPLHTKALLAKEKEVREQQGAGAVAPGGSRSPALGSPLKAKDSEVDLAALDEESPQPGDGAPAASPLAKSGARGSTERLSARGGEGSSPGVGGGTPWGAEPGCAAFFRKTLSTRAEKAPTQLPPVRVYEQRWSNLIQACLTFVLLFLAPVLRLVPTSLLWGFFAVMSLQSLPGSQFWDRLKLLVTDPKKRYTLLEEGDHSVYLESCPFPTIVLFTALQLALLGGIWGVTVFAGVAGICFPLLIMGLVPLRLYVFPLLFSKQVLEDLDSAEFQTVDQIAPEDYALEGLEAFYPTPPGAGGGGGGGEGAGGGDLSEVLEAETLGAKGFRGVQVKHHADRGALRQRLASRGAGAAGPGGPAGA